MFYFCSFKVNRGFGESASSLKLFGIAGLLDSLDCHPSNLQYILWGDETFGRHALLSRGWGKQKKQSVEPTLPLVRPTRVDH
jgi:hypothetical protein